MIKYNNSNIKNWYFADDNIIKVYRNNAVCYYKITTSGGTSGQTPCYAVVDDISQYHETEFVDVFNKADEKWYKLNNLNQYEEYGVYGSGRTITHYEGKLTVDDGSEYIYSGSSWINVGEVSGSSIVIKSPEYIEKDSSHAGRINLGYVWNPSTKIQFKFYSTNNDGGSMIGEESAPDNNDCRVFFASTNAYFDYGSLRIVWGENGNANTLYEYEYGNYYIKNLVTSASQSGTMFSTYRTNPLYLGSGSGDWFRTYYIKIYEGDTLVKDFIPWTDMNGNYGLFDKVSLTVYNVDTGYGDLTGSSNVTDVEAGDIVYPLYYTAKQDPPSAVTFSSMTEAEAYECPYVGLNASINGTDYLFDVNYNWVTKYGLFPVTGEYICYNYNKYQKMEEKVRNADDTWSSQIPPVYERGEMIESASTDCSHILPDVSFSVNYNAKTYNSSTRTFVKTYGQLVDVDAVISGSPSIVVNGNYITYSGNSGNDGAFISGYQQYFNRSSSNPTLTIVAKCKTDGRNCHLFANRYNSYNWMFRPYNDHLTLHGTSETGSIALNSETANVMSARVNSQSQVYYNNWSDNTSTSPVSFDYGGENNEQVGLFNGYAGFSTGEYFVGDFYWIYVSQNELTDAQILQVIDYNENL